MSVRSPISQLRSGYILLEVTLAILISTLILSTVFKISEWNLQVSNDAIKNSNDHMKQSAFFSFLDRAFQELSGDAVIELNYTDTPTAVLSELIIQNAGELFSWPNQPFTPRAIKILTKPNRDGSLDILLEYYPEYLISDPNTTSNELVEPDQEPLQTLVLLENMARFEWRVWNGRALESDGEPLWEEEWTDAALPRYFELNAMFDTEERPAVHIFWNPQKVNPVQHFIQKQKEPKKQSTNRPPSQNPNAPQSPNNPGTATPPAAQSPQVNPALPISQ